MTRSWIVELGRAFRVNERYRVAVEKLTHRKIAEKTLR
jgi:hypothetical protein